MAAQQGSSRKHGLDGPGGEAGQLPSAVARSASMWPALVCKRPCGRGGFSQAAALTWGSSRRKTSQACPLSRTMLSWMKPCVARQPGAARRSFKKAGRHWSQAGAA